MGAGVLDRSGGVGGEGFDGLLALAEEVEQLDPPGVGEGVADAGELGVEGVLELAVTGHRPGSGQGWLDAYSNSL